MKKISISIIIFVIGFAIAMSCDDPAAGFAGSETIIGKVTIPDSSGNSRRSVKGAVVYVGFTTRPTPTDYNYKTRTDSLGNFSIKYLVGNKNYYFLITYFLTIRNETQLFTKELGTLPSTEVIPFELQRAGTYEVLKGTVKLRDFTESGKEIPAANARVYLGTGFEPTANTYSYTTTTRGDGQFTFKDVPVVDAAVAKFYFTSEQIVNNKTIVFDRSESNKSNIENVVLAPKELPGVVVITVVDAKGTPQPGADVCIFANAVVAAASAGCDGSIFSGKTNSFGKVFATGLLFNGTYTFRARLGASQSADKVSIITLVFMQDVEVKFN